MLAQIAWVSCSQDLFAIVFVLAAFILRHEGRDLSAMACATGALLSKEPTVAALPVLALWDQMVGRAPNRPRLQILAYSSLALVWAIAHPGIHSLAARGFQRSASSYLGVTQPERWAGDLARYAMTLVNIPPVGFITTWWNDRLAFGLLALAILAAGILYLDRNSPSEPNPKRVPLRRIAFLAAVFGAPTLLAPIVLVRHWAAYFACIPAVGLAIIAGPVLARHRTAVVVGVLAVFLACGIWYRGTRSEREPAWTEWVFADAARAANLVRANLKTVLPTLPPGTQVVASISSTGVQGIYSTLLDGQALRVWYADPTLTTITTQTRRHGAAHEVLVRIAAGLDVIAIDFDTGQVRTTARGRTDIVETELGRPILNYARAVAAEGNTARALRITGALAYSPTSEIYARRLAAMILLAAGRQGEAATLLKATPALPRPVALDFVWTMLKEASYDERLDEAAFPAFGLSASDPETIRWVVRAFRRDGLWKQAAWYAQRLLTLAPEDRESVDVLLTAQKMGVEPNRMP